MKMSDYIMAVSITGLTASVLLFYYWLKSRKTDAGTAFILSLMFLLAGPMIGQYSGQIMFVDYMPFLCLAFIGVDRYFEQEKKWPFYNQCISDDHDQFLFQYWWNAGIGSLWPAPVF